MGRLSKHNTAFTGEHAITRATRRTGDTLGCFLVSFIWAKIVIGMGQPFMCVCWMSILLPSNRYDRNDNQ